jgi:hypothetical protein
MSDDMEKRNESLPRVISGNRPGPRAFLFSNRWKISILALFGFGSVAVLLVAKGHHDTALAISFISFWAYAVFDVIFADKFRKQQWIRWYIPWNVAGMLGPVFIYIWLIRGMGSTGPLAFWPLLSFPLYFLVRLDEKNNFFPRILLPIGVLVFIAFVFPTLLAPDSDQLVNLAAAIWLSTTLIVYLIHVRTWDFYKNRFDAYREIVKLEGTQQANINMIQQRIEKLGAYLKLQRLTILEVFRPDSKSNITVLNEEELEIPPGADSTAVRPPHLVRIIAKFPRGDPGDDIKPWPLSRGLLYESFRTRKPLLCMDNKVPPWDKQYFNHPDAKAFQKTRSEFVIPIFENPNGDVIGFADLQSDIPGGLHEEEGDYLSALTAMISPLLVNLRLKVFLENLEKLRISLDFAWNEEEAFARIAAFAREDLDVDVITYYKLGYGNGWPIQSPMNLGAWFPSFLKDDKFFRDNPPPIILVSQWITLFEENSRNNPNLLPSDRGDTPGKDYFILRENIHSTAFLPIGTRTRRVGALFLNYRDQKAFSQTDQLIINTFLQTIIPYLERVRKKVDTDKGFEHELLVLHDLLAKSIDSSYLLSSRLPRLMDAFKLGDNNTITMAFDELSNHLNAHISQIHSASLKTSLDALNLLRQGLDEAFGSATGQLEKRYDGRGFRWKFLPSDISTVLPVNFRLAIFSIVVEASHNAIREGNASQVNVTINRGEKFITVEILSDGNTWNWQNPPSSYTPTGIKSRLMLAKETMNADFRWEKDGLKLIVDFPVLPTLDRKEPYV